MAKTIAGRITAMASNFIAGVDAADALPTLQKLWNDGVAFSVDLLGEACVSNAEARTYQERYLDLVETLPGTGRPMAGQSAVGNRSYRPGPADQCLDQDQFALCPDRRHRFRRLACGTDRGVKTDSGSSGAEQCVGEFRHGASRAEGSHLIVVRALLRGDRFSRRFGYAIVSAQRHGRRRADHCLGAAHRAASHSPAHQGRLLGLRSHQRREDGLARARLDRQTRNRRLFRTHGREVCRGHAAAVPVKEA